jgi:hypothetical protein
VERPNRREGIVDVLAKTISFHHNDPDEFRGIVAELGYAQAANEFDKRPRDDKTRKGNFGEVLAAEFLRQVEGYDLPVYRLRWNTNPDTSLRGEDSLAFKFGRPDGSGREICVVESKCMTTFARNKVAEAHGQLVMEKRPRPTSLPFIYSVLKQTGQHEKAQKVLEFQKRFGPLLPAYRFFLMITTGSRLQSPFEVIESLPKVVPNLTTASLSLSELNALVSRLFEAEVYLGKP